MTIENNGMGSLYGITFDTILLLYKAKAFVSVFLIRVTKYFFPLSNKILAKILTHAAECFMFSFNTSGEDMRPRA